MIFSSPSNRMIGGMPHVREVGPHRHERRYIGADSRLCSYFECVTCGARTADPGPYGEPEYTGWLTGSLWPDAVAEPVSVPELIAADESDLRAEEDADTMLPSAPRRGRPPKLREE